VSGVLPPRWVRRAVFAPLMVLLGIGVVVTLPVTVAVAAVWSLLVPGMRARPLRVLTIVVLHLVAEAVGLVLLFVVWVVSGFGRWAPRPVFQRWHYDLVELYLRLVFAVARWVLHVQVSVEGPDPSAYHDRPLIVCCRHAGPGDSFLLVHALTNWYAREPRIVLKDTLQWDPIIDVVLNRLPTRFLRPGGDRGSRKAEDEIAELATHLDGNDALVIFPEGGNFTELRRARAIERLRRQGFLNEAAKAQAMRHVLAPRPGGVLAALDAAGEADVVWVAHTGVDHLLSVADVWRALPIDTVIRMRWWRVPPDEVPAGREERITWLFAWWKQIDDWIAENRQATAA
jgi:1-acyl-sn-glycerol-3-phosphate acyltransferase